MPRIKKINWTIVGFILIGVSIIFAILFIHAATTRPLTGLENVLLQTISLLLGIIGSFVVGRESASNVAKELIKPYARSAFRRLLSLYFGLSRIAQSIQNMRYATQSDKIPASILDTLEAMVTDHLSTADDALDDWRDIVPEDVEELYDRIKNRQKMEIMK